MTAVFLSHSSQDNGVTQIVLEWLTEHGYGPVFVDFADRDGMVGGQPWWPQLAENVKRAKVFLALISSAWMDSKVCDQELTIARSEGKPIVTLRLDDAKLDSYLGQIQAIDFRTRPQLAWQRLARALAEAGADPSAFLPDPSRPPFPGLAAFEVQDSALYFGREAEIADLLTRLDQRRLSEKRLLVIAGPSGSGKSSLLRAGLLARLRRRPDQWLPIMAFRPADGFEHGFLRSLEWSCRDWYQAAEPRHKLRELIAPGDASQERLSDFLRQIASEPRATPLLAIDQGEELLSAESDRDTGKISLALAELLAADSQVLGVLTIRSDLLGALQQHPELGPLIIDDIYALPAMPRERYALLIDGPIAQYASHVLPSAHVQPELRDTLIATATGADALPLVAFALGTLWEEHGQGDGRLLLSQLDDLGGLSGAVRTIAEQVIDTARRDPGGCDLDALRNAFVPGLAGVTEHGEVVRRRALESRLPAAARPLLDQLVQARLLVRSEAQEGGAQLEIAHEALLRQWHRLAEWIEQDFEVLRAIEELGRAAVTWHQASRDAELLVHRGTVLSKAVPVVERDLFRRRFATAERAVIGDYLASCQELERHNLGRQLSLEITLAAALFERLQREADDLRFVHAASLAGAGLDSNPYIRARDEVLGACSQQDVIRARSLAWRTRSELHAILPRIIFGFERSVTVPARGSARLIFHPREPLLSVLGHRVAFDIDLETGDSRPWPASIGPGALDYLPGPGLVLLAGKHGYAVAERATGTVLHEILADEADRTTARLLAGGASAVAMGLTTCRRLDFDRNEIRDLMPAQAPDYGWMLSSVSSGGGSSIAIAGAEEVFVFGLDDDTAVPYPSGQRYAIRAVEMMRDCGEVVFGGISTDIRVLNLASGQVRSFPAHGDAISTLAVLERDAMIVSTGWDGRAALWDAEHGRHLMDLPAASGMLGGSATSADGERIAIASQAAITIWKRVERREVREISHGNTVTGVAYHPETRGQIASTGFVGDVCAAIWTIQQDMVSRIELDVRRPLRGLSFSPDGRILAICGDTPEVTVYSETGDLVRSFESEGLSAAAEDGFIRNVTISRDASQVAWITPTGRLFIGDLATGAVSDEAPVPGVGFTTVCFSPAEAAYVIVTDQHDAYLVRPGRAPESLVSDATGESTFGRGTPVAFSQDGKNLAIAISKSGIAVMSPGNPTTKVLLEGHAETFKRGWKEAVGALAFDPQGTFLVSAGSRQSGGTDPRTIRLWDPRTGDQLMRIMTDGDCLAASVDPFSDTLCVGSGDKLLLIPFHRWLLSSDTSLIRQKTELLLGAGYEYAV